MNRTIVIIASLWLLWQPIHIESAEPGITAPPGFVVEKIFQVPPETMGSWSALTRDDRGRLIASYEKNLGLFLITPPKIGDVNAKAVVEKLPVEMDPMRSLLIFSLIVLMCMAAALLAMRRLVDADPAEIF